ncbi:Lrp/AsnC family transcriptional regulator [Nocardioides sp. NPDC092400]|uniref:Lrp/AsnC family transcriptional regulator n=1 Tax=Nocardioides sp. NPDC092400 TaxID=3155196 RepID=UPI00341C0DBD
MDAVDQVIVGLLKSDGRLPHREIARLSGISRSVVAARMHRLLTSGEVVVRGVVHPAVLGRSSLAHVGVAVSGRADVVAERVAERSDVPFVSLTAGPYAVVAELRTGSPRDIDEALAAIRLLPGVRALDTLPYAEVIRDVVGPTGAVATTVDATDVALLRALQDDGRASYVELAAVVGLSPAGVRRRVVRLLEAQVVRVGALVRQSGDDPQVALGIGIRLGGGHEEVVAALLGLPAVSFLARTWGRFDAVATLRTFTPGALLEALDAVRSLDGVADVESWSHLRFVKETYAAPALQP